jgi:BirA family biotin operon repressor/biotin-[acetyl-CoA-carboxylase] ligase
VADTSSAFPLVELEEIDSTNLEALRRAATGERGPIWLLAGRQTAGRGRSGRAWQTQSGNLAATLLLMPDCTTDKLHQLSLLTGIAVHDAVLAVAGRAAAQSVGALRLKWPNDLLVGRAKLGGILIESTIVGQQSVAAIGIGVNIAAAPFVEGRETAALAEAGVSTSARALLEGIDGQMRRWLDVWRSGARFDLVREAWLERAHRPGEPIIVHAGREVLSGIFAGIDETGALLIDSVPGNENALRRLTFGDVSLPPG